MAHIIDFSKFDEYNRRARLYPALFVVLPLILGVVVWYPTGFVGLGVLLSIFVWSGASYLIMEIGRDLGKKKEEELYKQWGGKPTTKFLRYRGAKNRELLAYTHSKLQALFPDIQLPKIREEDIDPERADNIYDVCTSRMRERTRDKNKFRILFNENCSFGCRRNLLGMKTWGILSSAAGIIIVDVYFLYGGIFNILAVITTVLLFIILLFWTFRITPNWVRTPAEAYAERLFASVENV